MQKLLMPYIASGSTYKFLDEEERQRVQDYIRYWNYYNGNQYEEVISDGDTPEIVTNWIARFINKYVATEFNSGFIAIFK